MGPVIETIFPDLKGKTKRIFNLQLMWLKPAPALPELRNGIFQIVHLHVPVENGMWFVWPGGDDRNYLTKQEYKRQMELYV